MLRTLAAAAAVTAVAGGVVMRRWDTAAGKRVADLTRARASDEWRHEERVAELETDLDESRELRTKLEHKLRAKRAELAGLRNEHAALLRRYATAETERASALEGRRLLEIETVAPARALPAAAEPVESVESVEPVDSAEPEAPEGVAATNEDTNEDAGEDASDGVTAEDATAAEDAAEAADESTDAPASPQVFSPAGSSLFLRANAVLSRIASGGAATDVSDTDPDADVDADAGVDAETEAEVDVEGEVEGEAGSEVEVETEAASDSETGADASVKGEPAKGEPVKGEPAKGELVKGEPSTDGSLKGSGSLTYAETAALPVKPTKPARASGHFTVPTAVAVAPAAPVRRPSVEGGFDFFGTQKGSSSAAMEAMQNEDLADVVGQEALALHKAEAESGFKPVDEGARGVGQVIDLTAHDETEHIDLAELRTAAS